jgi:hypothetical protein
VCGHNPATPGPRPEAGHRNDQQHEGGQAKQQAGAAKEIDVVIASEDVDGVDPRVLHAMPRGRPDPVDLGNEQLRPSQPPHDEERCPDTKRDQKSSDVLDSPAHDDTNEKNHHERERETVRLGEEEQDQNRDEGALNPGAGSVDGP